MTGREFNKFTEDNLKKISSLLIKKGGEYNLDESDRLDTFTKAAAIQGITPAEALLGMMTKHTISIYDMVKSGNKYPMEKWEEKCIDEICYLLLLLAVEADTNKEIK